MPPKRSYSRKRSRKNFVAIPYKFTIALGTLANGIVISIPFQTLGEDLYIISVDAAWSLRNLTAGEGPISVGFAHGDYSVTEIKEALDAEVTDPDDKIAMERSRRQVRVVGSFPGLNTEEVLNHGNKLRQKIGFSIGDGHFLQGWAQNDSGNANLTTGANVLISGHIYGRWQR